MAMIELDDVTKVYTGWDMFAAKAESETSQTGVNAAMVHGIEQMVGKVKIFNKYENDKKKYGCQNFNVA